MKLPSLKSNHLKLYRGIVQLLIRHGALDLPTITRIGRHLLGDAGPEENGGGPERLATDLEELGPTFVKLGQLLSTREDLIPEAYLEALSRLQDRVEAVPFTALAAVFEEEMGLTVDAAFSEFEREPLASASLGQVHRARLRNGLPVAVKILRPGIRESMRDELDAVEGIARLLDEHTDVGRRYGFVEMLSELRATLERELDYRSEAAALRRMGKEFEESDPIGVPAPVDTYCASRVLTMELIDGIKITELPAIRRTELDADALATSLCKTYVEHILLEGYFHADPHPGNVLLNSDGKLMLIDLGMVARLSPRFRRSLLKLVFGLAEGEVGTVVEQCRALGTCLDDYDAGAFERRVKQLMDARGPSGGRQPFGRLVFALGRAAAESGLRPPAELAIVGKTLLHLDEVGRKLDPEFDANEVIRAQLMSIAARKMLRSFAPRRAMATALELNEFVQELPGRINTVLDAMKQREFEVRIRAFDEAQLMASLQRIGSRITLGLVSAALIVGASLTMTIEARATIFDYPALAVLLLMLGVSGALLLVAGILVQDYRGGGS